VTILPTPTISYAQTVMADTPVAYYRLDETSGSGAHDFLGGPDGQYFSATLGVARYNTHDTDTPPHVRPSRGSYAGNNPGIDFSTWANDATFSIEAWVKSGTQTSGAGIVALGYGNGGEQFSLDTGGSSQAFRFVVRDAINVAHNASGSLGSSSTAWR